MTPEEERATTVRDACALISGGATVKEAASTFGIDRVTLWRWKEETDDLRNLYARARDQSADADEDEAVEVARQSLQAQSAEEVQAARLLVDTLKWRAAKRRPKEYGDKQSIEVSGGIEHLHLDALRSITAKARIANDLAPVTSPMLLPDSTPYTGPIRGEGEG